MARRLWRKEKRGQNEGRSRELREEKGMGGRDEDDAARTRRNKRGGN